MRTASDEGAGGVGLAGHDLGVAGAEVAVLGLAPRAPAAAHIPRLGCSIPQHKHTPAFDSHAPLGHPTCACRTGSFMESRILNFHAA